jgi:hypothetical protein
VSKLLAKAGLSGGHDERNAHKKARDMAERAQLVGGLGGCKHDTVKDGMQTCTIQKKTSHTGMQMIHAGQQTWQMSTCIVLNWSTDLD